jgi:arsenate reductase (thioredoxin)
MTNARRQPRVLFVCWHNAARSQMAAAFLAAHGLHIVSSAGTHAASAVHPLVIQVMDEVGIDLHAARPTQLTRHLLEAVDVVVRCLAPDPDDYPWPDVSARFIDWSLPMPANEDHPTLDELRGLRDAIEARVSDLVATLVLAGA